MTLCDNCKTQQAVMSFKSNFGYRPSVPTLSVMLNPGIRNQVPVSLYPLHNALASRELGFCDLECGHTLLARLADERSNTLAFREYFSRTCASSPFLGAALFMPSDNEDFLSTTLQDTIQVAETATSVVDLMNSIQDLEENPFGFLFLHEEALNSVDDVTESSSENPVDWDHFEEPTLIEVSDEDFEEQAALTRDLFDIDLDDEIDVTKIFSNLEAARKWLELNGILGDFSGPGDAFTPRDRIEVLRDCMLDNLFILPASYDTNEFIKTDIYSGDRNDQVAFIANLSQLIEHRVRTNNAIVTTALREAFEDHAKGVLAGSRATPAFEPIFKPLQTHGEANFMYIRSSGIWKYGEPIFSELGKRYFPAQGWLKLPTTPSYCLEFSAAIPRLSGVIASTVNGAAIKFNHQKSSTPLMHLYENERRFFNSLRTGPGFSSYIVHWSHITNRTSDNWNEKIAEFAEKKKMKNLLPEIYSSVLYATKKLVANAIKTIETT